MDLLEDLKMSLYHDLHNSYVLVVLKNHLSCL